MAVLRLVLVLVLLLTLVSACGEESAPTTAGTSAATAPDSTSSTSSVTTATPTTTTTTPLELGVDWVRVIHDEGIFEDVSLSDVVAFDSGWIATGVTGDEGALGIWHSLDGVEWEAIDGSAFGGPTDDLRMVGAYPQCFYTSTIRPIGDSPGPALASDGDLVVLGCGEGIWTSTDGMTWSRAIIQTPDYYLPWNVDRTRSISLKIPTIQDIGVGPGGLVAVGRGVYGQDIAEVSHTCAVWVSADGLTWELPSENKADFWDWGAWYQGEMDAVAPFEGAWIAGGTVRTGAAEGNIMTWHSDDGHSYQALGEDRALGTLIEPGQQGINALISTEAGLIAVGWDSVKSYTSGGFGDRGEPGQAAMWSSLDGISWARLETSPEAFVGNGYEVATDIVEAGPGLVAIGAGFAEFEGWGIVWVSANGVSWERVPEDRLDRLRPLAAIAEGSAGLVAVGGSGVWVSGDFPVGGR